MDPKKSSINVNQSNLIKTKPAIIFIFLLAPSISVRLIVLGSNMVGIYLSTYAYDMHNKWHKNPNLNPKIRYNCSLIDEETRLGKVVRINDMQRIMMSNLKFLSDGQLLDDALVHDFQQLKIIRN